MAQDELLDGHRLPLAITQAERLKRLEQFRVGRVRRWCARAEHARAYLGARGRSTLVFAERQHDPPERVPVQVVAPPTVLESAFGVQELERELRHRLDRHR